MAEEQVIEMEAESAPPKLYALIVRGFVCKLVYDPESYEGDEFTFVESDDAKIGQRWTGSAFVDPVYRRQAQVRDGVVVNVCDAAEGYDTGDGSEFIPSDTATTGQIYAGGKFTDPPPAPISREQVDAERDRRTEHEFEFSGKRFQLNEKSLTRITAMGADARFAIAAGAEEGDYFWADPTTPFGFIATDNTVMPMDAQTMATFSNAAKLWVSRLTFKGLTLKSTQTIPQDFTNDNYWSAS